MHAYNVAMLRSSYVRRNERGARIVRLVNVSIVSYHCVIIASLPALLPYRDTFRNEERASLAGRVIMVLLSLFQILDEIFLFPNLRLKMPGILKLETVNRVI